MKNVFFIIPYLYCDVSSAEYYAREGSRLKTSMKLNTLSQEKKKKPGAV